jgi:hypothetical protein
MSDPLGTVRKEEHQGGHSIWVRQLPTYPDSEFTDTEWTCIWSTAEGNIGQRVGDGLTEASEIIGAVPGTPAHTGEDVEVGARAETLPESTYWTDQPLPGRVVKASIPDYSGARHFTVEFDEPQVVTSGDGTPDRPARYTNWAMPRLGFRLIEED